MSEDIMGNIEKQPESGIIRYSPKNVEILRQLVDRDVIWCVSTLVYELCHSDDFFEEVRDVLNRPDYESAVEVSDEVDVYYDDANNGYVFKDEDGEISDVYDTYEEACEAAVIELNLDYDYVEAYEHWIVSKWFAEKLAAHGEMVGDVLGLTVWGRCATGQPISMDGVIFEIAKDMEILEGMKYSWG